jgi:peptidyl-prolyl cis-trans isomerase SurA
MTKRATQHGSMMRGRSGRGLAMLFVALLIAMGTRAQTPTPNTTAMPVAPAPAAPPAPKTATTEKPSAATSHAAPTEIVLPTLPRMPEAKGAVADRVVAIVNGDLILDSDVDQERRFAALLPYGEASGPYSRDAAIERLINRELILQQTKLQPQDDITMAAATKDLDALRSSLPTCKQYHCETKAGWDKFLASQGFTEKSLTALWEQRMVVLAFIEQRFRMGIKITEPEIETYYQKTLLPQYAAQHATAPPVDVLAARIQEILLQQRVSNLLGDWLQSLRAQGNVVVLHPGEEAP